jgi:NAD(P)-dependent dehydrogenase (short-subunit alcohol dehydrogenase family)
MSEEAKQRDERRGRLTGKRVVIVGGTSGMGRATAVMAAGEAAEVIVAGRRATTERHASLGDGFRHETVDASDEASVQALFERVGTLDHLLVTATPRGKGSGVFMDQDAAAAQSILVGKVMASWACARWAAPRMPPDGSITFVTGGAVVRPKAGITMIAAAFAALETLTRGLAVELGPRRVNTIRPGYTDSEMWSFLDEAGRAALRAKVSAAMPVRRMGTVEDIAEAAVFLMTNRQVTGTILEVSGGETLVDAVT